MYSVGYTQDDGKFKFVDRSYQDTRNIFYVISLGIREEKKFHISKFGSGLEINVYSNYSSDSNSINVDLGYFEKYRALFKIYKNEIDELLFFENVGLNNGTYCQEITEEDRNKAERIKLI